MLSLTLLIKADRQVQTTTLPPATSKLSKENNTSKYFLWTAFDLHVGKPWGEIPTINGLNLSKHLLD